ncbi:MAG: fibronectin type III domain-containing protein [Desulfovermiculus sp.]
MRNFSFLLALSFGFLVFSAPGMCATVKLAWDKPTDSSQIAGYNLYYAPSGNAFPNQPTQVIDAPDKTTCTISGLTEGQIYGFVATSFDADGNESSYSNEVYYTIPSSSPSQDSDGDGLSDDEEEHYGLDPTNPDTNGNGIPDQDEVDLWGCLGWGYRRRRNKKPFRS